MAITKTSTDFTPRWYGDTGAEQTHGLENWQGHNGGETWSDGGAADAAIAAGVERLSTGMNQLLDQMRHDVTSDMAAIVGEQVKDALSEYASTANFQIGLVDGAIMVGCEMANDHASVKPMVPLIGLLSLAQKAAIEDQQFCESFLRAMHAVLQTLVQTKPAAAQAQAAAVAGRTSGRKAVVPPPKGKTGAKPQPTRQEPSMQGMLQGAFGDDFGAAVPARR